jgi:hypothetical protein
VAEFRFPGLSGRRKWWRRRTVIKVAAAVPYMVVPVPDNRNNIVITIPSQVWAHQYQFGIERHGNTIVVHGPGTTMGSRFPQPERGQVIDGVYYEKLTGGVERFDGLYNSANTPSDTLPDVPQIMFIYVPEGMKVEVITLL